MSVFGGARETTWTAFTLTLIEEFMPQTNPLHRRSFCDHEVYNKNDLVSHIYNNHKDKPTITSYEATRAIVYADSFPFVMRNGSGSGGREGE